MLADISGSCRAMTSLALTYMGLMREVFPGGCHLFVFVNHLVPVDRYFSNENVTAAVESINKNVPSRGIYSNYGVPLKELRYDNTGIINKDTTIVMLGDCRNNRNYSSVEDVEWLSKRASNFFVLNPEPRDEWGQGDSIADLYAKSGAVVSQVSSAKDLLNFCNLPEPQGIFDALAPTTRYSGILMFVYNLDTIYCVFSLTGYHIYGIIQLFSGRGTAPETSRFSFPQSWSHGFI